MEAVSEHMASAVAQRMDELGYTPTSLAAATGLSQQGLLAVRQGRIKQYQRRLTMPLCVALQWSPDSIERLMRDEPPIEMEPATQPDDLVERIERLELALTALARHQRDSAQSDQLDRLVVEIEAELAARRRTAP